MNFKKILVILNLLIVLIFSCYSQDKKIKLTDTYNLSVTELLDLRLQILSCQISCGNHKIIDMGSMNFPVSITLNEKNEIVFEIVGEINAELSKETHKEIITESFEFISVSINELLRNYFPLLEFENSSKVYGFWYYKNSEGHIAKAKWINSKFEWINLKN